MRKAQFGSLLHAARQRKGYSLRDLAERTGMNYSRLSRIEHGTRPAPGLVEIRTLAESLDVDMSELLVSSGTPREVMEHLLWSERIQHRGTQTMGKSWLPEASRLMEKNTYRVRVVRRDGAVCVVRLGDARLNVLDFGRFGEILIAIPPESVLVFKDGPDLPLCTAENVLAVRVKKLRRLGQVVNLVLAGDGMELNSLHERATVEALGFCIGDSVIAAVPAVAIRTSSMEEAP